ncbi:MAG: Mu-like prophage major head subunit gpT family protein [Firmicutes bacterium]|nr:Mu-like prophage major head subunit gpT family protein [Bacillota bacterium]
MTTSRSNLPDLLADGLRTVLFEKYNSYPEEYRRIYNIHDSKKQAEKDSALSGLGAMPSKSEGASVSYANPLQGYDITYTHTTYGLGFRVTQEMMDDDQYGKIKKMPRALARSARHTVEQTAANIFNYGFSTTYNSGGDSKALFATDHPLTGGGSYANTPSVPADLSVSSLQAAIQNMEETVDDNGLLLAIKPKLLVVPPALKWTAREMLDSTLKPYTSDNEANAFLDEDLAYFVWHYLTDDDAWFLLSDKDEHELNFFWRKKLATENETDFDTGDLKFKATMRFSVKWTDWRGTYGSPGA